MSTVIPITPPPPPPPPPPPEKIAGDNRTDWQIGWGVGWSAGYLQAESEHSFIPYTLKRWWQSKTLWFSKALVAVGAWVEWLHLSQPVVRDALGEYGGLAIIVIGLVTFLLRMSTSGKISK